MIETPWGPIGYITYKRTYSRKLRDNSPETEEFTDTIERVLQACSKQLKINFKDEERNRFREILLSLKGTVAGRFLWQLGTKTVDKLGLMSLQNCSGTVVNHPVKPFIWTFDALMLGSGVGYNIQKEHIYELPKVKKAKISREDTNDADFIVPDSREGWVRLLENLLISHFRTGEPFTYSTICIRSAGAPIRKFGGVASGPESLCKGISDINNILNRRANKKIRPIDCLDIMNIIGQVVVSGNIRRSAQISLGDMDDFQYLNAKRWDLGNIPNWRSVSNNSVVCNDFSLLPPQFWEGYTGNGEPYGLINLNLARTVGRTGETQYPDEDVIVFNPCAEQPLNGYETCCLAEIHLPNIESKEELKEVAKYLYIVCKHSLRLKCHQRETEKIVHNNMRMGIGITGYMSSTEEQKSWLPETYEFLRNFDNEYSDSMGWPRSIKLTTVKPSGTMSSLSGVTPGCHPGYSKYFLRRMRISSSSPLVQKCREHGFPVEFELNFDGTEKKETSVVSFPCSYPENARVAKETTAIDQLEVIKDLQSNWSDNAVSCTVYYKLEELEQIKSWLKQNYNNHIKSVSFLLHKDHGFAQAPFEEISKDQYEDLVAKTKEIKSCNVEEDDIDDLLECATGACPVK